MESGVALAPQECAPRSGSRRSRGPVKLKAQNIAAAGWRLRAYMCALKKTIFCAGASAARPARVLAL
jgi:hypothetical protein